jgi:ribonuclease-3
VPGQHRRAQLRALLDRAGAKRLALEPFEGAFVHESAAAEARAAGATLVSNERLEFLGDAIVGAVSARWLFERYPNAPEGELALRKASLVSDAALGRSAVRLGFGSLVLVGRGLARSPGHPRPSLLADAFEAFVAALDAAAGLSAATAFVIDEHLVPAEAEALVVDPKTTLQEYVQGRFSEPPRYRERAEGPAHERSFSAEVAVEGETLGRGAGASKKVAQQAAALAALAALGERYGDVRPREFSEAVALPRRGSRAKPGPTAKRKKP